MGPPKRRTSKKKEVLPDLDNLPDGKFNYYIRGWSSYTSIRNLTKLSHELVASCTAANREVGPIPKMNVLILPTDGNEHIEEEDSEGSLTVELELADQLRLDGITKKLVRERAALIRSWKPVDPAQELPPPSSPSQPPPEEVGNANDNNINTEGSPERLDNTARALEDVSKNASMNPIEEVIFNEPHPSGEDARRLLEELQEIEMTHGAHLGTLDNCITGDLHILGMAPSIVVHPDIVVEAAEEEKSPTKRKLSKAKSNGDKGTKGKRGKKTKLTPEQIEEMERQKAEEQALRERQVQEAIERAQRKEEYLKTFSHPDRWAHITISGLTFTGKIRVSRAHVTFQNCRFMGQLGKDDSDEPQLSVYPFSVVHLTRCTFETPATCGLYAFPCSQVLVKKCLFCGLPHQELASVEYKDRLGEAKDISHFDNAEVSSSKSEENFLQKFARKTGRELEKAGEPLDEELMERYNDLRESSALLVGIQVDSARIYIEGCRFTFLGIGVLFSGRCVLSEFPHLSFVENEFKPNAVMSLKNSWLHHMYGTAVVIAASEVSLKGNEIHDCEYYGVDCYAKCANVSVLRNHFGIYAVLRVRKGTKIKLLNNTLHETLVDDNIYNNPCLDPVY